AGEKLGDITYVYIKPNEQLELFYYDWDTDEELYVDNVEIAALTDKRPIGVDLSYVGNVHVIISQDVFDELNQRNDIEIYPQLVLTTSDPVVAQEKLEQVVPTQLYIESLHQQRQEENNLILLMSVFTYGFIALITLIS